MKNLITGIQGFAGSHLADRLLGHGEEVVGWARDPNRNDNILHLRDRVRVIACDIRNPYAVREALETVRPDRIYHLAALSFVPAANKDFKITFEINILGTLHVLEAVRRLNLGARVLCVGSSEEYGLGKEKSFTESDPLNPVSLYGVSKASGHLLARSYNKREGLNIVQARPFNHIGPRQDDRFVCSSFARQVAEIQAGANPLIRTGNLETSRDFTDVRDVVRAYHLIMERGKAGEIYNICSEKQVRIRAVLDHLIEIAGIPIRIETDPARFRPENHPPHRGSASRLRKATGWEPEIPLDRTLRDTLNYWKERAGTAKP